MQDSVIAGHPTAWRVYGAGPRAGVMLHCSLAHSGAWSGLAARLGNAMTLTAFDQPGHGRSGDWDGTSDLHRITTDIAAHFAELAPGPVDLIGHSFGATVALRLTLERPDLVRSLVLVEPVLFAAARQADPDVFAGYDAGKARFAAALAMGRAEEATLLFQSDWGTGAPLSALPESQRRYLVDRIGMILPQDHALTDDSAGLLRPGGLESIAVPVLIVEGGDSPAVIDAINRELARRIPGARRLVVPGAGHMVPITHPDVIAGAICEFLGLEPAVSA